VAIIFSSSSSCAPVLRDDPRGVDDLRHWKRRYGLRRMRWRGLAKAAVQVHLTAIAYNLKRSINILAAQR